MQTDDGRTIRSSLCGDTETLCLLAPWKAAGWEGAASLIGTSHSTPQVSAALDTVWAVWPDMDILDLRNLAFDCAENRPAGEGETSTARNFPYSNGRSFTSNSNLTWGHGIISLTCLFTPNGGLQNPATLSTSLSVAYGRELAWGLSASLQADHWRTLATRGRSLWEAATLRAFLLTAVLISRAGRHEFALQAAWRSGLSGSLDVSRRSWTLAPRPERSVWRIWRHVP